MERLRYVARARGTDPAVLVAETAEAIESLRPEPADLVNLCRRLVDRNPTCAPMWWFCATLLADVSALDRSWELAAEIEHDRTAVQVAHALAEGAVVATVGYPDIAADALVRRGDLTVVAIDAGGGAHALVRRCDRAEVEAHLVPAESALAAIGSADVMLVEADACSPDQVRRVDGFGPRRGARRDDADAGLARRRSRASAARALPRGDGAPGRRCREPSVGERGRVVPGLAASPASPDPTASSTPRSRSWPSARSCPN